MLHKLHNQHRFTLEKYSGAKSRFTCPSCRHREKTFVRYIDTHTNAYLGEWVGRCNREVSCGYHLPPKKFFQDNGFPARYVPNAVPSVNSRKGKNFIPLRHFEQSLSLGMPIDHLARQNRFVEFLCLTFGEQLAAQAVGQYCIGSSNSRWSAATVFWQIDRLGKIRTGKVIPYDVPEDPTCFAGMNCKRIKNNDAAVAWMHKILRIPDFRLEQCFFGEHLLSAHPDKTVAIVEGEKTAVICSIYLPQFVWLAAGTKSGINAQKAQVLAKRTVILYPDLGAFEEWNTKREQLSAIATVEISRLLENHANARERSAGYDLADYLLTFNPADFLD